MTVLDTRAAHAPGTILAALDVGFSKAACLMARAGEDGRLEVLGVGVQRAQTGADGAPLDFDACARAIRIAVDQAERMAGTTASAVIAGYGGGGLSSKRVIAQTPLPPGPIGPKAARAALAQALAEAPGPGRVVLHAAPLGYRVDDGPLIPDPRGMIGKRLGVEATVVTAPAAATAALCECITEAGVRVSRLVAAPYAAGLAVLSPQEMAMGGVVLDFGAGHVGIAAFAGGGLVLAESLPMGGARLTQALSARLAASFAVAERVKVLHGDLAASRLEEAVEAPRLGDDGRLEPASIARGAIVEAIGPQLEAMMAGVRARLAAVKPWEGTQPWRAALCGGGAQLAGLRDLAGHVLHRPVRPGRPVGFGALDDGAAAASLAAAAGLLRYAAEPPAEAWSGLDGAAGAAQPRAARAFARPIGGAMGKALSWLKENF
ncbi:MAG: cell division protein FtsA [Hyphomonadaceae bacterium]